MIVSKWVRLFAAVAVLVSIVLISTHSAEAWTPLPVVDDPNVRMPGTQPNTPLMPQLAPPSDCLGCHGVAGDEAKPGFNWQGSMMGQSARDPLFWAALTVAAQDSIWAFGNPNATDICLRCHMPGGWLRGHSEPTNGSAMTGEDFDGVQCDFCHRLWNPFFEASNNGTRETNDFSAYFDETNASGTPSNTAAANTYTEDSTLTAAIKNFNGDDFFSLTVPASISYTENANGQFFISSGTQKRASFADAAAPHPFLYSRYHKSKFFCSTCHDVSNPVLANLDADSTETLPTEKESAFAYAHVERTFSEFMLSDFAVPGGIPGRGAFRPGVFETSNPDNRIRSCQDCHMRDVTGKASTFGTAIDRPTGSTEHPNSGQPKHDLTGGNVYMPTVLAATLPGAGYRADLDLLLNRPMSLTMDLSEGLGLDKDALLDGAARAKQMLQDAARIRNVSYDSCSGLVAFRIYNDTGHKLITGYPEGRRMWVNVRLFMVGNPDPIYIINPYNISVGTLKGKPDAPLGANERFVDELVYEATMQSDLTGEEHTFHFVLSTDRFKDNRIPPIGFNKGRMDERMAEPYHEGSPARNFFTGAELAGGYDDVSVLAIPGVERVEVSLYYQTTTREYVKFLRDEINGTGDLTLTGQGAGGDPAYLIQGADPNGFFPELKDWGDTIWEMWDSTRGFDGNKPILMTHSQQVVDRQVCNFLPSIFTQDVPQ